MKTISFLTATALCIFLLNTASAQTNKSNTTDRNTQQPGQPGSNGSGDGIQHNMLNGTGDGLKNVDKKQVYSGGSGAKATLPLGNANSTAGSASKSNSAEPAAAGKSPKTNHKGNTGYGVGKNPKM
jgi:hypothetical protein